MYKLLAFIFFLNPILLVIALFSPKDSWMYSKGVLAIILVHVSIAFLLFLINVFGAVLQVRRDTSIFRILSSITDRFPKSKFFHNIDLSLIVGLTKLFIMSFIIFSAFVISVFSVGGILFEIYKEDLSESYSYLKKKESIDSALENMSYDLKTIQERFYAQSELDFLNDNKRSYEFDDGTRVFTLYYNDIKQEAETFNNEYFYDLSICEREAEPISGEIYCILNNINKKENNADFKVTQDETVAGLFVDSYRAEGLMDQVYLLTLKTDKYNRNYILIPQTTVRALDGPTIDRPSYHGTNLSSYFRANQDITLESVELTENELLLRFKATSTYRGENDAPLLSFPITEGNKILVE